MTRQPAEDPVFTQVRLRFFLIPTDVHTFAHLNVLSGCCYRYPRGAHWDTGGNNGEKVRRKSKWGGNAGRKETESGSEENVERERNGAGWTIIQLVVSLLRMRERVRRKKEGKDDRGRAGEWALYLSAHQSLVMSSTHPLTHPLIPWMPQPNEPSVSQWLLYTAAPHTAIISLCYRQFIALYSSDSISIPCCHDLLPSHCHVTYGSTFSIGTDKICAPALAGWVAGVGYSPSVPRANLFGQMCSFGGSRYLKVWMRWIIFTASENCMYLHQ